MGLFDSIPHSWESWALTHMLSLSPSEDITCWDSLLALSCAPCRRADAGKLKLFLLHFLYIQAHLYPPTLHQNLSTGLLAFHNDSPSCKWLSRQCFPGDPRLWPWGLIEVPQATEWSTVRTEVCLLPSAWVGETPECMNLWCWIPQVPQRHIRSKMDAKLLKNKNGTAFWPGNSIIGIIP